LSSPWRKRGAFLLVTPICTRAGDISCAAPPPGKGARRDSGRRRGRGFRPPDRIAAPVRIITGRSLPRPWREHRRFAKGGGDSRGSVRAPHPAVRDRDRFRPRSPSMAGQCVLARLIKQVVEFAKNLDGKRAGRFQKHLENARPVAPDKRISAPCFHAIFPLPGSVRGESPKRSKVPGS
jgi:hypothetical protein